MKCPRITIAGMMTAVALIAFDSFIFVAMHGAGVLLIGLALTVGIVCWWRCQGRDKAFWLGFEVAGLAAALLYIGTHDFEDLDLGWPRVLLVLVSMGERRAMCLLQSLTNYSPIITSILIWEVTYGLPMLLIASIGGLLATLIAGGIRGMRTPHARRTMSWLKASVGTASLILSVEASIPRYRARDLRQTVRVFNGMPCALGNPQLRFNNQGPRKRFDSPILGGTLPASEDIVSRGMYTWYIEFSSPTNVAFSFTTQDGTVKTGYAFVNTDDVDPASVDFYVEPAGVRVVILPRKGQ